MTLQELTEAIHEAKFKDHPHCATRKELFPTRPFTEKGANELTRSIEAFIRYTGNYADRINNTGIYDPKLKKFRKSNTRRGIADIMASKRVEHQGKFFAINVAIEIKYGNDKLSEFQLRMKDDIEKAGGVYLVARTWNQFINDWNQI
jgi:hypothetical protein